MILLLLFSISSTIRASNAQKPKKYIVRMRRFFNGAQSIRNAAENYKKKKNRGFFCLGQNLKNL